MNINTNLFSDNRIKDWNGNSNSIYKTLGASNHTTKEREEYDFYATDPIAIDKLLTVEKPSFNIWECACGEGHLLKRLQELGYNAFGTDIVDRGCGTTPRDFFNFKKEDVGCGVDILTNPPYKYAKEFVLHALDLVAEDRKIYMFLKLTFLEGKARYKELFSKYPPQKIYVFCERVMCAKNGKFQEMKDGGGSAVAYAWFVWQKGWHGKTTIEWI